MRRSVLVSMLVPLLLAQAAQAPARAPSAPVVVLKDVVYAVRTEGPLLLDIYEPRVRSDHAAIVLVHGGGWRHGSKERWARAAREFVRAGFVVFVPNYRLAPPGGPRRYPAAQEDISLAIAWVKEHAPSFGADPRKLSALGSSAGGQIVFQLAASIKGLTAVGAWSPAVDLSRLRGDAAKAAENYLGCRYDECPGRYRKASPLFQVRRGYPPAFIGHSREDNRVPIETTHEMSSRLREIGVEANLREIGGSVHGHRLENRILDDTIAFFSKRAT